MAEAFAVCREASTRVLKMRHYDVQLLGGMVLHEGRIAEMKTGEGKTLVATLAVYFNAIAGRGVHLITVNEYLATRDAQWMGQLYNFLGLSVGVIVHGLTDQQRKEAYAADITYGTNSEFGFDYLRDNMKLSWEITRSVVTISRLSMRWILFLSMKHEHRRSSVAQPKTEPRNISRSTRSSQVSDASAITPSMKRHAQYRSPTRV